MAEWGTYKLMINSTDDKDELMIFVRSVIRYYQHFVDYDLPSEINESTRFRDPHRPKALIDTLNAFNIPFSLYITHEWGELGEESVLVDINTGNFQN